MTLLLKRVRECWRLASHYRGQITGQSSLSRAVFAAWRIRTNLIRLSNLRLERQPIPVQSQNGHSFDDDALIRAIAIIMNQTHN